MSVKEGQKVWVRPRADVAEHPAIVLRVSDDGALFVAFVGTGTAGRDREHVLVEAASRAGRRLKLSKDTYFYDEALFVGRVSEARPEQCFAGRDVFIPLMDLAQKAAIRNSLPWWPGD